MPHSRPLGAPALSVAAALLLALAPAALAAQVASPDGAAGLTAEYEPPPARDQAFDLTIRNIMRGPEHVGQSPGGVRFLADSEWIYFQWLPGGSDWDADRELYRVRSTGGEPERVTRQEVDSLDVLLSGGDISPDGRWRLVSSDGDIFLVDREDASVERLTDTRMNESSPRFNSDGTRILYELDDNVFSMDLEGGGIRQITDIRSGGPQGSGVSEDEEDQSFLERQQAELFEYIQRMRERRARRDSIREATPEVGPQPAYVPERERVSDIDWSRDGDFVMISTFESGDGSPSTLVPFWVTESGYTEARNVRSKVGGVGSSGRVGLLVPGSGHIEWFETAPEDFDGPTRASTVGWNDAGTHALVRTTSDDNKWWWLHAVDARDGSITLLGQLYDEAWVGGPCGYGCMGWIPGTERVFYASEESGYAHLYSIAADGSGRRTLTSGEWEVLDVEIPEGQDRFLLTTNEGSPFDQHVAWMDFDGGEREYLTGGRGSYDVTVSRDGERLAIVHSRANRPPELFVASADDPDEMEQVTVTPTGNWLSFPWLEPEIVRFRAEDGVMVPARIYRPSDMGAEPHGGAVVFVHGAGYLHNVHNYWSTYYREYMFHHLLAASGYTVLDIDYRGSAGYGRDWRTDIYRWMGGKDLSDQVDGARWLVAEEGIDPDRIGIYGGSYGGFITLMALFNAGDTFKSGAALRSVTDWAHYNHGYTSNILNTPEEDPEAYERSSPIYFAENFGPDQHLLIAHGMVDTNVHFSDVVRLAQRLIELGKENWEMAVYPVEGHGFETPSSWTDEYRRIYELFERTISRPGCTEGGRLCAVPTVSANGG